MYTFIKSRTTGSQLNVKAIRREQPNGTNNFEPNGTNNFERNGTNNFELSLNNQIYQLMWQDEQFSYWIVSIMEPIEGNTVLLLFFIHKPWNFPNKSICWESSMWLVVVHLTYAVRLDWFCFEIRPTFSICFDDLSNRNDYPNLNMYNFVHFEIFFNVHVQQSCTFKTSPFEYSTWKSPFLCSIY